MATKIIKLHNGSTTYVPVTLASAVQYSYTGGVMSVQEAIGTVAKSLLPITDHFGEKDYLSYDATNGLKLSGIHGDGNVKMVPGAGISFSYTAGGNLTIASTADGHAQGVDNQHLSASVTSNVGKIELDGTGGEVKITPIDNPAAAGSNVAHVNLSYSSTDGIKIKVTYTDNNDDYRVKTENKNTTKLFVTGVDAAGDQKTLAYDSGVYLSTTSGQLHATALDATNITASTSITKNSKEVATEEYVNSKLGELSGALIYKGTIAGNASSWPSNPQTGYVYVFAGNNTTLTGNPYEAGDLAIYNGSEWEVVNGENQVSNGTDKAIVKADGTEGTATIATVDGTNITLSYSHGTPSGTTKNATKGTDAAQLVANTGKVITGINWKADANGHVTEVSYTMAALPADTKPDHDGTGTANRLVWWTDSDTHGAYTGNWGSSTKYTYVESGILKEGDLTVYANQNAFSIITAGTDASDDGAGTSNTSSANADSATDTLTVKGGNKWITTGTSDTSNADTLIINHATKWSATPSSTDTLYKLSYDKAGHIATTTAVSSDSNLLASLTNNYKITEGNEVNLDDNFLASLGLSGTTGNDLVTGNATTSNYYHT